MASTDYYTLYYNATKNRVYITVKQYWTSVAVVPDYLKEWESILKDTKVGFTVLNDFRLSKEQQAARIKRLHATVQGLQNTKGVRKVATIVSDDISTTVLDDITSKSKSTDIRRSFNASNEAISWLDQ